MRTGPFRLRLATSRGLVALVFLSSFAALEIHLAMHRPADASDAPEIHDHLSQPFHVGAKPSPVEPRCPVCLTSSQRRGPAGDLTAVLPRPLAGGTAIAGEYPLLASFGIRRPLSRGPPRLL